MPPVASAQLKNVAPGSIVVVRDAEWIVLQTEETTSGTLVRCQGLSELVRDTTAAFYSGIDTITVLDPEQAELVADGSSQYRTAKLWLEAMIRKSPVPLHDPALTVSNGMLLDPLNYQRRAVQKALDKNNLRPRILLADAVGLGKTLEIGMILSELVRRGRGERILIVTPKHVLEQMQHEMWTRFALPFVRLDSVGIQRVRQQLPATRNPFSYFKRAIISIDTLKQDKYRAHLAKHRWDAVVIDESHNITGRTLNNRLAHILAPNTEALILASATPHNGDKESFAELIRLLEPTAVRADGSIDHDEVKRIIIRRHRNSDEVRNEVGNAWAERLEPRNLLIDASPAEDAIADELAEVWLHPESGSSPYSGQNSSLFPWTLAKSFLSSPTALAETVKERRRKVSKMATAAARREEQALDRLAELTEHALTKPSAKYEALLAELKRIGISTKSDERVVIFSERVPTLNWLVERIRKDMKLKTHQVAVLHGTLSDEQQQAVVESFKQKNSPIRVLVTGDVASEGVNLHSQCHELIHFDIPWSLIRIEQRNGRIDRYGQRQRPQITSLLLQPSNEHFTGDIRVLSRVLRREAEAHTALGDAASLMGKYNADHEEREIIEVLRGARDVDEVLPEVPDSPDDADDDFQKLLLMFGADSDEDDFDEQHSTDDDHATLGLTKSSVSTGLFDSESAYLEAALRVAFTNPGESPENNGAGWQRLDRTVAHLEPPRDLRRRLEVLPQSYLKERGVVERFVITDDRSQAAQLLKDARDNVKSATSWPEAHFLGPLHPVLSWAGDRVLSKLGRNQVFAVRGDVEDPRVIVQATLTNRRGLVVSSMILSVDVFDAASSFATVTPADSLADALEDAGFAGDSLSNPGPIDVAEFAAVVAPAVRKARAFTSHVHDGARDTITQQITAWSERVDRWSREADGLVQAPVLKQRRLTVEQERELAAQMEPAQSFVRPLLVIVPADTPVARSDA